MEIIEVRESRNGFGIFTKKFFIPNEDIFEVKGTFITCEEDDQLDEKTRNNSFRFDENRFLSPSGEIGDYLNHSCEPNAKVMKNGNKLLVAAAKEILAGEEVLIDYSTILASDDIWEMDCNCGSKYCRGKIKSFDTLPEQLRNEYVSLNIVPDYILNL